MEPLLSTLAAGAAPQRNVPRDLQARLYREIGVAAVAAALDVRPADADAQPSNSYGSAERWSTGKPLLGRTVRAA